MTAKRIDVANRLFIYTNTYKNIIHASLLSLVPLSYAEAVFQCTKQRNENRKVLLETHLFYFIKKVSLK